MPTEDCARRILVFTFEVRKSPVCADNRDTAAWGHDWMFHLAAFADVN